MVNMGNCQNSTIIPAEIETRLQKLDIASLKKTSFGGLHLKCRVISVYDGDTMTIVCYPPFSYEVPYVAALRVIGYDAPEMRPSLKNSFRDLEKKAAQHVKEYAEKWLLGKIIEVHFADTVTYGRLLGEVYLEDRTRLSDRMIEFGCKPYAGDEKREPWTMTELDTILSRN